LGYSKREEQTCQQQQASKYTQREFRHPNSPTPKPTTHHNLNGNFGIKANSRSGKAKSKQILNLLGKFDFISAGSQNFQPESVIPFGLKLLI
jgi:hypothetical protein